MIVLYIVLFVAVVCLVLLAFVIGYVRGKTDAYLYELRILREHLKEFKEFLGGKK